MSDNTVSTVDKFMVDLLKRVQKTGDGVDVKTQIDFFGHMVKWAATKNKIDPEEKGGNKIREYRSVLNKKQE